MRLNLFFVLRAGLAALLFGWPGLGYAAVIDGSSGWQPLRSGARTLGVSDRMVARILAAGLQMTCPGSVHKNGGALNGWLLGPDATSFYTNAHGVIDIGADRQANFIEPLDKCDVRSYRDLVARGARAASYGLSLPADRNQLMLASFRPQSDSPVQDRARLTLQHAIAGAAALSVDDVDHLGLAIGQEVLMVSLRPPVMRDPEIQACHIRAIDLNGGPGELLTDCDNNFGNSAALYFVRDPADHSMLVPVALHEGCYEKLGDNQNWNPEDNTAVAIMLRRGFFSFVRHAS